MRTSESAYDRRRLRQWLAGEARADGVSRRDMLRLLAAAGLAGAAPVALGTPAAAAAPGIVKPLPGDRFTVRGTNAETRFASLAGTGYHTPNDRFFVRNHTATPTLPASDWALTVHGDGLTRDRTVDFTLADLRALPSVTHSAFVECAGNGRSFFTGQQGQPVSGTAWTLGAIGVARWRGVRLADVLRRAGLSRRAVDVLPRGLDADYVTDDGTNLGRVRRPLPLSKALDDVLLAYEMNGEPLPPDHGHPVRVLVPSWVGIASVKWVGDIEVSAEPLYSPWNTDFYRLFGDAHPDGGERTADPADDQERLGTGRAGEPGDRRDAPPHRPLLVRRGRCRGRGGQHRLGRHLAPGPAARRAPAGRLGPLVHPLAPGGARPPHAAGPGDGHHGPHATGGHRPQHTGLSLRRGRAAPRQRGLTPPVRRGVRDRLTAPTAVHGAARAPCPPARRASGCPRP